MRLHAVAVGLLCLAIVAAAGCQRQSQGVFLELSGRMFVFNYRVATANYLVTLRRMAEIPEGSHARALFDNPRGGPSLVTEQAVFAVDDRLTLASLPVECVMKDKPYRVLITLTGSKGELLQEIETTITSDVDQSVMPGAPLVVGPVYTPNPQIFKADGSADFSSSQDCPIEEKNAQ